MEKSQVLEVVQERYGAVARGERSGCGCGSTQSVAAAIGYSAEDVQFASDANLGLGCGNPLALSGIQPGMTVLDLGPHIEKAGPFPVVRIRRNVRGYLRTQDQPLVQAARVGRENL